MQTRLDTQNADGTLALFICEQTAILKQSITYQIDKDIF